MSGYITESYDHKCSHKQVYGCFNPKYIKFEHEHLLSSKKEKELEDKFQRLAKQVQKSNTSVQTEPPQITPHWVVQFRQVPQPIIHYRPPQTKAITISTPAQQINHSKSNSSMQMVRNTVQYEPKRI